MNCIQCKIAHVASVNMTLQMAVAKDAVVMVTAVLQRSLSHAHPCESQFSGFHVDEQPRLISARGEKHFVTMVIQTHFIRIKL